ncbi:MAG: DUF4382 domain-containing protein [Ferruginibacter sp.]
MKHIAIKSTLLVTAIAAVVFVSCSKSNADGGNSTLHIRLTDGPTNLAEVNVDIREVKVKFSDDTSNVNGWVTMATNVGVYNLLGLQNGVDTLLATAPLPKDVVKEIRFVLGPNNSIKDTLGNVFALKIPSGAESGLKIKVNKKLNADLETLIIDFDAALSIFSTGAGNYMLKPVLKIK